MAFPLVQIISWLLAYKYFILFPIAVIEGPIITIIAGLLAASGQLNLFVTYIVVIAADTVADALYYSLGRWGSPRLIKRWGHYIGFTIERVEKIKHHFAEHAGITLFMGKFAYSIEIVFLVAAGFAKVPFQIFLASTIIPTLAKSLLFLLIGYYFGRAYVEINRYLHYTSFTTVAIALSLVLVYFIIRKIGKKYAQ